MTFWTLPKFKLEKWTFTVEQKNPAKLAQAILHNFEGMAETHKVSLQFEDPLTEILCWFDELRLRQIITNIVNNAIKYNRHGGKVRVYFGEETDHIRIYVEDTGKGIDPSQFAKVFNEL